MKIAGILGLVLGALGYLLLIHEYGCVIGYPYMGVECTDGTGIQTAIEAITWLLERVNTCSYRCDWPL